MAADQFGSSRDGLTTDKDLQFYLGAFDAIDADLAHLLVVPTDAAQVVATMQLTILPGLARRGALRAQIEAVRVRPDYRSRGLGAALFEWAIEEARRRHCALVQLTTDKSRADAHGVYERLGFVASHEGLKLTLLHYANGHRCMAVGLNSTEEQGRSGRPRKLLALDVRAGAGA